MFSNLKRAISLVLLVSAAGATLAAPAPVSDVNDSSISITPSPSTPASTTTPESEIQRLERLLTNRNRVQIQMQQQMDDMAAEISELRGLVERNSYEMKKLLDRQRELFVELDRVRSEAKASVHASASSSATGSEQQGEGQTTGGQFSSNENEEQDYKSAVDLILSKKDYTGALEAFKQFQVNYPDSVYAPNAHYWLGQLYFARKQDAEAIESFTAVISYEKSGKRADSMVKLGDLAKRNNKPEVAKEYYQKVISEYPGSASAKAAKRRLN